MTRARIPQRGVTLLELIVTLAVVGILSGAAMWSIGRFAPRNKLKNEAAALVESLWELRSRATTGQVSPCIDFQGTTGYRLFRDKDEPRNGFPAGDTDELIRRVVLKNGLKIVSVEGGLAPFNYVCFESRGIIGSANGAVRVKLGLVSGSESKVVELLPATGIAKAL